MRKVFQLYREEYSIGDELSDYIIEKPMCEMSEVNEEDIKEIILDDILSCYPGIDETAVKAVLNDTMEKYFFIEEKDQNEEGNTGFSTLEDIQNADEYWEICLNMKKDSDIVREVRVVFIPEFGCEFGNVYWVQEVNDPKYFVIETFGAPRGGCLESRKILAGPFDTREEANAAKENVTKHEYEEWMHDVDVFGIDITKPTAQAWLKCASKIFELEKRFDTIEERNRYCIADNHSHLCNLRAYFGLDESDN